MAGANGPTSVGGTTDTPNPEGGAVEKPPTGKDGTAAAAHVETGTRKPGDAGGVSLDKDAQD